MKTVFYKKVGRRYEPVSEYDNEYLDSFPKGDHLVSVYPGGGSRRYRIDPAFAPMIAAGRYAEDAISRSIQQATELRPHNTKMNEDEIVRWRAFISTMPEDMRFMMTHGSVREAAEAGVKAMIEEADKLMKHESVRKAYDHFMLMCKLAKDENDYQDA
jgi:hypothetical protein